MKQELLQKNLLVKEGERVDDLQFRDLKVIQDPKAFCFGTDAVLLSHFVHLGKNARVIELCAGCGVISLLLAGEYTDADFTLVEIQEPIARMAERSVRLNGLENRMRVECKDLRQLKGEASFHAVVVNPPYQRINDGSGRDFLPQDLARKELTACLDDVTAAASRLLNDKGRLFMVHRAERIAEIFTAMRSVKIEPKRLCTVAAREGEAPKLVLVEGVKNGRPDVRWDKGLVLYGADGELSQRVKRLYEGERI